MKPKDKPSYLNQIKETKVNQAVFVKKQLALLNDSQVICKA